MSEVRAVQIEQEVTIAAPPARVYDALTKEVSAWRGLFAERLKDYVERGVRSGLKR